MENKAKSTKTKHFKFILNGLFYAVILILVAFSIANIQVKRENDIANIFGYGFLSVQSDSMEGMNADSFNKGDLIFVRLIDHNARQNLTIGDVITFYDVTIRQFNTHRIVDIDFDEQGVITKGDKATANDMPMPLELAQAVHIGTLPKIGNAIDYMQSPTGFALLVILPIFLIFIYEGVGLIRNFMALNKEKYEEELKAKTEQQTRLTDEEKERIRQELLAELKANKD